MQVNEKIFGLKKCSKTDYTYNQPHFRGNKYLVLIIEMLVRGIPEAAYFCQPVKSVDSRL